MATTTASMNTTTARRGIRVHITRMNIFSVLFILIGAWMLLGGRSIGSAVITKLTFGEGLPELPVSTMAFTLVVGVLYLFGGIVGLLPSARLYRIKCLADGHERVALEIELA